MAASDVNVTQEVNRENVVEIYLDTLLSVGKCSYAILPKYNLLFLDV